MEFNDSIMNDDVRKALQQERTDHMEYLPGMEILEDSHVEEQVISATKGYDYSKYTAEDVKRRLQRSIAVLKILQRYYPLRRCRF